MNHEGKELNTFFVKGNEGYWKMRTIGTKEQLRNDLSEDMRNTEILTKEEMDKKIVI